MRFLLVCSIVLLVASPAFAELCILGVDVELTPEQELQITAVRAAALKRQFIPHSLVGFQTYFILLSIGLFLQNMLRLKTVGENLTVPLTCIAYGLIMGYIAYHSLYNDACDYIYAVPHPEVLSVFGYLRAYPATISVVGVTILLLEIAERYREKRSLKQAGQ